MLKRIAILGFFSMLVTACGGGDLPDTSTVQSSAAVSQVDNTIIPDPLQLQATLYTLPVGSQSALMATGGNPSYTYSIDSTAFATISGNIVTAVAPGTVSVSVTDGAGTRKTVSILVTAVVTNTTTTVAPATSTMSINGGRSFKVLQQNVAGSVPLYRCNNAGPTQIIYSLSTSGANCVFATLLGYVYSSPVSGSAAFHMYSRSFITGNAISGGLAVWTTYDAGSTLPAQSAGAFTDAGVLGYAPL